MVVNGFLLSRISSRTEARARGGAGGVRLGLFLGLT
jgi:hypothetical protein